MSAVPGEGDGLQECEEEQLTQPRGKASQRRCHHTEHPPRSKQVLFRGSRERRTIPGKCQPRDKGASLEIKKYSYNAGAQDRKGGMVLRLER